MRAPLLLPVRLSKRDETSPWPIIEAANRVANARFLSSVLIRSTYYKDRSRSVMMDRAGCDSAIIATALSLYATSS